MSLKIAPTFSEFNNDNQAMLFLDDIEEIEEETIITMDMMRNLQNANLQLSKFNNYDLKQILIENSSQNKKFEDQSDNKSDDNESQRNSIFSNQYSIFNSSNSSLDKYNTSEIDKDCDHDCQNCDFQINQQEQIQKIQNTNVQEQQQIQINQLQLDQFEEIEQQLFQNLEHEIHEIRIQEIFNETRGLPKKYIKQIKKMRIGNSTKTCSICLCDFVQNDVIHKLPKCQHIYHKSCLEDWLKISCVCNPF